MSKKTTTTTTTTVTTVVEDIVAKKDTTYYTFILDRSGSMDSIRQATINNYNEQIGTLKELQRKFPEQKYIVSLVAFNNDIETIIDNKPVNEVPMLTEATYIPIGGTALRDAIGKAIAEMQIKNGAILESRKDSVEACLVVLTDGEENASKEYSQEALKSVVEKTNAKKNWSIMFIGADEKSVLEAKSYGVHAGNIATTSFTMKGMGTTRSALSNVMYRRAYASNVGASLDNTSYLCSVSDASGVLNETLDLSDIDAQVNNTAAPSITTSPDVTTTVNDSTAAAPDSN